MTTEFEKNIFKNASFNTLIYKIVKEESRLIVEKMLKILENKPSQLNGDN